MTQLQSDFKFFTDNRPALYKRFPDKFLVIKNEKVAFAADSFEKALSEARNRGFDLGTFLIQQCTKDESGYTQTFHSRAIFA